jgi:hypothetical protein
MERLLIREALVAEEIEWHINSFQHVHSKVCSCYLVTQL